MASKDDSPPRSKKPNYFVAIPIADRKVLKKMKKVQKKILKRGREHWKDDRLKECVASNEKCHFTLVLFHIDNDDTETLGRAKLALQKAREAVRSHLRNKAYKVCIDKIGHFDHRVVYTAIGNNEELNGLRDIRNVVNTVFAEHGLGDFRDGPGKSHEWNAHITLFKIRDQSNDKFENLPPSLYEKYTSKNFGRETLSEIQLCSMDLPVQKNGYFHVAARESLF